MDTTMESMIARCDSRLVPEPTERSTGERPSKPSRASMRPRKRRTPSKRLEALARAGVGQ